MRLSNKRARQRAVRQAGLASHGSHRVGYEPAMIQGAAVDVGERRLRSPFRLLPRLDRANMVMLWSIKLPGLYSCACTSSSPFWWTAGVRELLYLPV